MKYLDGNNYVGVKDHRCRIHRSEKIILGKRNPATSLRTQYQVENKTQFGKNQKVIKNDNDEVTKNVNIHHLIVLHVNKTFGWDLIMVFFVEIANILSTNKNINLIKRFLEKIIIFY